MATFSGMSEGNDVNDVFTLTPEERKYFCTNLYISLVYYLKGQFMQVPEIMFSLFFTDILRYQFHYEQFWLGLQ